MYRSIQLTGIFFGGGSPFKPRLTLCPGPLASGATVQLKSQRFEADRMAQQLELLRAANEALVEEKETAVQVGWYFEIAVPGEG